MSNTDYIRVLREYSESGVKLIVGEAFGISRQVRKVADDYPKMAFLMGDSFGPYGKNMAVFDNFIHEPCYLMGMLAGKMTKNNKIGMVGGYPIGEVNRLFNAFMADGCESVKWLCEVAADRGLMVDMHCDESDDPLSRHVETLAYHTRRLGLGDSVTGSHLTSMHSMDNYYVSKLLPLMAESGMNAVCNIIVIHVFLAHHRKKCLKMKHRYFTIEKLIQRMHYLSD